METVLLTMTHRCGEEHLASAPGETLLNQFGSAFGPHRGPRRPQALVPCHASLPFEVPWEGNAISIDRYTEEVKVVPCRVLVECSVQTECRFTQCF